MDFALSKEQKMLQKAAREFLVGSCPKSLVREMEESRTGWSPELWKETASLGWLGLVLPEEYGGQGMGFLDLAAFLEQAGRACMPGPFFPTVVLGCMTILDAGNQAQKSEYLPRIASGELIVTLALTESDAGYDASSIAVKAETDSDGGWIINGTKLFVPDAHVAHRILVVARTDREAGPRNGISIFIVDADSAGLTRTLLKTMAGDKQVKVDFERVRVGPEGLLGELNHGWPQVEKTLQRAAVAQCCLMSGAAQEILSMSLEYGKSRVQFGRPIGSFQAIQHHCADMAIDVDSSRFLTYKAAWMLSEGIPCRKEVAMAKAWTADAYRRVAVLAHRIHGATGFTMDHDLQFYSRRVTTGEVSFGDASHHREVVAQEIGLE
jgi:alkylation response protein AidB-like acyl-CoA dehydrogenase